MHIVHLTASPFYGGPERQMLGLARALPSPHRTSFLSFPERGLCRAFLDEARRQGFVADALQENTPYIAAAVRELTGRLRDLDADVLCCHGYKADLIGLMACRRRGLPVVAVARGWTGATWRVRLYEWLDRRSLPRMDAVVCVSDGQADKVRECGVPAGRVHVIRNAIHVDRFRAPPEHGRAFLQSFFAQPRTFLVGAAGRLSPEKGFDVLVEAAEAVIEAHPDVGFVLFGDGSLRSALTRRISRRSLERHFVLAGFRADLDRWMASFDLTVLPSYTEGLPNVVLESLAARVPVVASAVGGTPEVVDDGASGFLVPAGKPEPLARRIVELLGNEPLRRRMGQHGQRRMRAEFTFAAQAQQYCALFETLRPAPRRDTALELPRTVPA
jgi:glycosyltransferase involved in cell wall biosynthesis